MKWLKENWYEFLRFNCLTGYIDLWRGDCINNPNYNFKNGQNLNSGASYLRLNNGRWMKSDNFERQAILEIRQNYKEWNAKDLFEILKISNE